MNVKKIVGANSREALRKVREQLGPDTVILSNRAVPGGVELLALAGEDVASLAAPAVEPEATAPLPGAPSRPAPRATATALRAGDAEPTIDVPLSAAPLSGPPLSAAAMGVTGAGPAPRGTASMPELQALAREIRSMRGSVESQLAELAWMGMQRRDPARTVVIREMLAAGFSPALARHLSERMPAQGAAAAIGWIKSILALNLLTSGDDDIVERGGVYAIVGPTGVGKTTTTAKLAARSVMRHGARQLALITTDGYRIGGHEQLRIYGKMLGVMVHSVRDATDLRIALTELRGKHTVLIDTAGLGQRDRMVAEQIGMLAGAGAGVKRLLCLSAAAGGDIQAEVVRAYRGDGLHGCIVTKLDEAVTLGGVLDVAIREKLRLHYVADGQRVPEDLHAVDARRLVDRAFAAARGTAAFRLTADELPIVISAGMRARGPASSGEVVVD